jgi:23S rRNA (cytidine1920-2'-O)/16S rRNA (cytidine1409-2'-O)-methyltransferase
VVVREGTNARHLSAADFPQPPDWLVCDASFISLELVLPAVLAAARSGAQLVCLIKPQFEVGRARVGKKGVVKDPALHAEVCDRIAGFLQGLGWRVQGIVPSPVPGPEGNLEFLLSARKEPL